MTGILHSLSMRMRQLKTWGVRGALQYARRSFTDRSVRRFIAESITRNPEVKPQRGITIIAHMSGSYSLSKTMRDFVTRLKRTDIPFQVLDCGKPDKNLPPESYAGLVTPREKFRALKYSHVVEMVSSPLPCDLPVKRCRIVFWEGETGLLDVYPYLVDSDVIIAMSDFNADYYKRDMPKHIAVKKVVYPLMPVPPPTETPAETRCRYGLPADDFIVFFNFDLLAFSRKNPDGLMKAFAKSLGGKADAKLVLKTNHSREFDDRRKSLASLAERLGIGGQVVFIDEYLASPEIYALTVACDVYASLHRSEGFGLGIAEAMQLGKPVVVTDYSAPLEFCNKDNAILIPFRRISLNDGSPASKMGMLADADIDAAADALRTLYADRQLAAAIGARAKRFMESHFSDEAFQKSIEELLET